MDGDAIGAYFDKIAGTFRHYCEDDFTLYDTTFHKEFHFLMCDIYKWMGMPPQVLKVRRKQIVGYGRTVGGIRFQIQGTMKSGASDTCLANSVINLLTHVFILSQLNGISMESVEKEISMIVMGDDNIFCLNDLEYDGLRQQMGRLGLLSKVEEKDFQDLTFLNLTPFPTTYPRSWRAVLKPGRIMARIQVSETLVKSFRSYQSGVALGMLPMAKGVPILEDFLKKLISRDERAAPIIERFHRRHLQTSIAYQYNEQDVWDFLSKRYKTSVPSLRELNRALNDFDFVGAFSHPVLDDLFRADKALR